MHRLEITQTNLSALADPDEVFPVEPLDDGEECDRAAGALPAAPRAIRVDKLGERGERGPAPEVIAQPARLAVEVPAGAARLVLLALDGEGQVIASRDLGVEPALTAEVFLDLLAAGLDAGGLDGVDLHVRLTPELATALSAAAGQTRAERRPTQKLSSIPLAATPRRR